MEGLLEFLRDTFMKRHMSITEAEFDSLLQKISGDPDSVRLSKQKNVIRDCSLGRLVIL